MRLFIWIFNKITIPTTSLPFLTSYFILFLNNTIANLYINIYYPALRFCIGFLREVLDNTHRW